MIKGLPHTTMLSLDQEDEPNRSGHWTEDGQFHTFVCSVRNLHA